MEIITYKSEELQRKVKVDYFSILGKCFQLTKAVKALQDNATTAMGTYIDGGDHALLLASVGDALDLSNCIKEVAEEVDVILKWMRNETKKKMNNEKRKPV